MILSVSEKKMKQSHPRFYFLMSWAALSLRLSATFHCLPRRNIQSLSIQTPSGIKLELLSFSTNLWYEFAFFRPCVISVCRKVVCVCVSSPSERMKYVWDCRLGVRQVKVMFWVCVGRSGVGPSGGLCERCVCVQGQHQCLCVWVQHLVWESALIIYVYVCWEGHIVCVWCGFVCWVRRFLLLI